MKINEIVILAGLLLVASAGAFQSNHNPIGSCLSRVSSVPHLSVRNLPQRISHWPRLAEGKPGGADDLPPPAAKTAPSKLSNNKKALLATTALIGLDIFFRRLLQFLSISFPSALAGCGALFATFLLVPGGPNLYNILAPGAALLAKWLPVFFVPSLITLPLADSVGSVVEVSWKI